MTIDELSAELESLADRVKDSPDVRAKSVGGILYAVIGAIAERDEWNLLGHTCQYSQRRVEMLRARN